MITEREIIDKYLGIPYLHLGRTLKGLDCWGLPILVYKEKPEPNIEIFDLENYEKNWALKGKNHFIDNYYEDWQRHGAPKFLDIILFKNSQGVTNHAGIYLSKGRIIQASRHGVIISRLDGKFLERVEGIYRHIEMIKK